ncbi:hypothetical protein [Vagococcus xieshaowenii]|uniref:Uncharacterized protein n=1 Tax=Vagococcus xieshaowenii TaxID=2562451 RepID=A0AAJ5EG99_9ENTE|nr:hypothetical protein [Vagococcus xieshaowenii]QCA28241.1 hypothetical protein E4Z98_02510 [Vagococcus xieshaowenii]TFZ41896.1 hypothetical protein E4031_04690 [Vagococcus xieshaowenii]
MSLAEELNQLKNESFDVWFERWFEKMNLQERLKVSAKQGYSGYMIDVDSRYSNDEYAQRRLRDKRTVKKLESKLPGVNIRVETVRRYKLFGRDVVRNIHEIHFEW